MPKHVVLDVVGTCVSYDAFYEGIEDHIGPKLRENGIKPSLFGFAWMESAEREFTYLSISDRYASYNKVMTSLFYRMLHMSGISDPRSFATDAQRDAMVATYAKLRLRPGIADAITALRNAGFTIWCFTTADMARVQGYFKQGGIDMPAESFTSCDTAGLAKPAMAAYKPVYEKLEKLGGEKWFAAAHMWDVSAAKLVGFKGAYCSVYEKEACAELFEPVKMDVVADGLVEMAQGIIKASS